MSLSLDNIPPSLASGRRFRDEYVSASPWPCLVLDEVFASSVIADAEREQVEQSASLRPHRSHRQIKAETASPDGPASRALLATLQSLEMISFLRELTGIDDLVADPSNFWGGLHATGPGGFTAVHRDFYRHPLSQAYHRVNVLLYLNSDWPEEYGGALELWDAEVRSCGRTILPEAGRLVIFETTPDTLHGLPDPVRCPPGRSRLSLATYYYSAHPPATTTRPSLLWQPRRPQDPVWISLPTLDGARKAARRVVLKALVKMSARPDYH